MEFDAGRFYNVRHAIVYIHTQCLYTYVSTYVPLTVSSFISAIRSEKVVTQDDPYIEIWFKILFKNYD